MASPKLPDLTRETPFSTSDAIMHTTKYAERSFGAEVGAIGTLEMDGNKAALIVTVNSVAHKLHWARQQNGEIAWFADDSPDPIKLGPAARALGLLRSHLAG